MPFCESCLTKNFSKPLRVWDTELENHIILSKRKVVKANLYHQKRMEFFEELKRKRQTTMFGFPKPCFYLQQNGRFGNLRPWKTIAKGLSTERLLAMIPFKRHKFDKEHLNLFRIVHRDKSGKLIPLSLSGITNRRGHLSLDVYGRIIFFDYIPPLNPLRKWYPRP